VLLSPVISRSIEEEEQCKHRRINSRGEANLRRGFWLAFRESLVTDDWNRSTMGKIVLSLEICLNVRKNVENT